MLAEALSSPSSPDMSTIFIPPPAAQIICMLPGLIGSLAPIKGQWWMYATPFLGQHLLLADIMGGKSMPAVHVVLSVAATLALAGLLLQGFTRLLRRERIIFGR